MLFIFWFDILAIGFQISIVDVFLNTWFIFIKTAIILVRVYYITAGSMMCRITV